MARFLADTYERIIIALLIFQYAFVNIVFSVHTQNIVMLKDLSAPILSFLILAFWILGDLAKCGRWELPKHGVVPVSVIALLVWVAATFRSTFTGAAIEEWGRMATYFVQVWAMIRFCKSMRLFQHFLTCVIVVNIILVGYGLSQLMGMDLLVIFGRIPDWGQNVFISTHGNPNFFAGYLVNTFPLLIGYWLVTRNPALIVGLPPLFLLNLYEIMKSDARGAYIGTAAALAVLVLGILVNFRHLHLLEDRWRKVFFQAAGTLIAVALVVGLLVARDKVIEIPKHIIFQFTTLTNMERSYTNQVRLIFWQMGLDGGRVNPVWGRGFGTYNYLMPEMRPVWYHRTGVTHNTDHCHNEYIEWFAETGIVGLSVFLWVLLAVLWTSAREVWRHRKGYHFPLVLACAVGPWGLWIQGLFDVETRWTGNAITLWFGVGLALAFVNIPVMLKREETSPAAAAAAVKPARGKAMTLKEARENAIQPSPHLPYVAVALLLAFLFLAVKSYDYWNADYYLRMNMAFTEANQGTLPQALEDAERARVLNPQDVSIYYKLAYTYLVAGQLDRAMATYRTLQSLAPNYAQIHINLAFLNDQMGFRTASAWERDRAAAIEHNTRNHRDAAMYWTQLGQIGRALPHLRMCFTIERDRTDYGYPYWYQHDEIHAELAQLYLNMGQRQQALKELRRAVEINPGNTQASIVYMQLLRESGQYEEAERIASRLAPNSPQLVLYKASKAILAGDYKTGLAELDAVIFALTPPGPNQQPMPEAAALAGACLQLIQKSYEAGFEQAHCLDLAGWLFACQGDFGKANELLSISYQQQKNPATAERLGKVQARLK